MRQREVMGGAVDNGEVWKVELPSQDEAQDMETEQATDVDLR